MGLEGVKLKRVAPSAIFSTKCSNKGPEDEPAPCIMVVGFHVGSCRA